MKDILSFSVPGSDSIHELQLGMALIRFAEFDLVYFREQCVGMYRKSEPEMFMDKAPHLKEYLHNCHPYCKAHLATDFDKITLDCVIEDICAKEGLGLEELWVKNLSAQDRLGQALFRRITEYKTGHAINQWTNLVRMQSYASSKMSFIYGGGEEDAAVHKIRKQYYDLVFAMTAAELGLSRELPKTEVCSVPFLPEAGAVMKTAAKNIVPLVSELTEDAGTRTPLKGDDCVRDLMAGMVLKVMSGIQLPDSDIIGMMVSKYSALPGSVYRPVCFKAIIDMEFDQMVEKGFYIRIDGKTLTRLKYSSKKETQPEKQQPAAETPAEAPAPEPPELVPAKAPEPSQEPREQDPPKKEELKPEPPKKEHTKRKKQLEEEPPKRETLQPVTLQEEQPKQEQPKQELHKPILQEMKPPDVEALMAAMPLAPARPHPTEKPVPKARKKSAKPEPAGEKPAEEKKPVASGHAVARVTSAPSAENDNTGKVSTIIKMAEDPARKPSQNRTLQEVNTRCNLIWTSMNVETGWSITASDASEWFRYLTRLRFGIGTGELKPEALDKFLDATLEVYKLLPGSA